jgi:hypothetical protein
MRHLGRNPSVDETARLSDRITRDCAAKEDEAAGSALGALAQQVKRDVKTLQTNKAIDYGLMSAQQALEMEELVATLQCQVDKTPAQQGCCHVRVVKK